MKTVKLFLNGYIHRWAKCRPYDGDLLILILHLSIAIFFPIHGFRYGNILEMIIGFAAVITFVLFLDKIDND